MELEEEREMAKAYRGGQELILMYKGRVSGEVWMEEKCQQKRQKMAKAKELGLERG